MGWIHYLHEFNFASALVRLLLAAVTGTLLGMGQTRRGRSAGMRTYTLVCTGAALTVRLRPSASV